MKSHEAGRQEAFDQVEEIIRKREAETSSRLQTSYAKQDNDEIYRFRLEIINLQYLYAMIGKARIPND